MPGPKQFVMSKDSADTFQRMVRDYKSGRLKNPANIPPRERRQPSNPRLGKVTTAAIPAGGTGEVTLQKPDWTATTRTVTAVNDSDKDWEVGDKVYILRIAGAWRIIGPVGASGAEYIREGFLDAALTAPALGTDSPTSVTVSIYERDGISVAFGGGLVDTGNNTIVYNCDPDLTAPAGAYCRFKTFNDPGVPGATATMFTYVGCTDALS